MTLDRISVDPEICMGQPTIRGTRITVALVLKLLASGMAKPGSVAKVLLRALPRIVIELEKGAIISVTEKRVKIRDLPVGTSS